MGVGGEGEGPRAEGLGEVKAWHSGDSRCKGELWGDLRGMEVSSIGTEGG